MNDTLSKIIIFAAGAGIGSVVTWRLVKAKYEQIANEEIDSVKEYYSNKSKRGIEENNDASNEDDGITTGDMSEKPDLKEYVNMIRDLDYEESTDVTSSEKEEVDTERPYVITPEEFGEYGYEIVNLIYYADDILADEADELVDDVEYFVGKESLSKFEDGTVFVRNDRLSVDYEISLDNRNYADVVGITPSEDV